MKGIVIQSLKMLPLQKTIEDINVLTLQHFGLMTQPDPLEPQSFNITIDKQKENPSEKMNKKEIDVKQLKPRQKMTKTKRKAFNAFKNNSIPNPQKLEIKTKTNEEVETFILTVELETSKELLDHFKEQMKADEFIQQRITDIKNGVKFGSHDFYIKNGLLIRRSHIRGSPTAVTQIVVLREARQMFL